MESAFRKGAQPDGLCLIETLRWTGTSAPRWPGHAARLTASAARLGWPCDPAAAWDAIRRAAPPHPARLRLTLDASGALAVTTAPLPPAPTHWRVTLATETLHAADPWLTLKSTQRAAYDRARAALPPGLDEAILLNDHGQVCDGSITTVFFDRGQGLRTPPLACGLLPGVLRAALLASGRCREEVLLPQDLPQVRLWVGNALRGLIPAVWTG